MTTRAKGPYRRAIGILAAISYLALPLLVAGGQSAFRFDLPTLTLHFFGSAIRIDEFFVVLLWLLVFAFAFIWVTQMFGRLWCGWLCPQSVLVDIAESIANPVKHRLLHLSSAALLSMVVGAATVWYFIPPGEFIGRLLMFRLNPVEGWAWAALSLIVWLNIVLLGRRFCATACPYAKLQGALYDGYTMVIGFDSSRSEECMGCEACVRACPVGIDIRKGLQSECVNCAECIDACSMMLARKDRPGIIGYHFGSPGGRLRFLRPAPLIFGAAGLFMAGLLVFHLTGRQDMELTVLPDYEYGFKNAGEGRIAASFALVIEYRGRDDKTFRLASDRPGIEFSPSQIDIQAGARRKVHVLAVFDKAVSEADVFELMLVDNKGSIAMRERVTIISSGR